MKTLMITGAGGFFGSAVVKQLSQSEKYRIIAVTSGRKANDFPANVQADSADLLSAGEALLARHKPDILLHLAWGRQDGQARNSAANIEWLEASLKLLRAFIENGGKRFVSQIVLRAFGPGPYPKHGTHTSLSSSCSLVADKSIWATFPLGVVVRRLFCGDFCSFSQLCCPLRFQTPHRFAGERVSAILYL